MSLASTQADIDAAIASLLSSIDSYQATYFATYGRYWQGLVSHKFIPANGSTVAADNLSNTPPDQVVTWATFGVTPGTIPAAVRVDAYQSPSGWGYTKKVLFIYSSAFYSTTTDVARGATSSGTAQAWQGTADTVRPVVLDAPTYTSIDVSSGSTSGGTAVTATMTGVQSGMTITVGGASATGVTVNSTSSVSFTTPAGSSGAQDIVFTNIDGQTVTAASAFTYSAASMSVTYDSGNANYRLPSWFSGSLITELWGGGGGGGGADSGVAGGGAAGGSYCKKTNTPSAGDVIAWLSGNNGAKGVANTDGHNGSNSTCTTYSLIAGGGGKGWMDGTGGTPVASSGGDTNTTGTAGSASGGGTTGGNGGACPGGGGAGSTGTTGTGTAGTAPGGGGCGGGAAGSDHDGGAGGHGRVKFTFNPPTQPTYLQSVTTVVSGSGSSISASFTYSFTTGSILLAVFSSNAGAVTISQTGWVEISSGTSGYQAFYKVTDSATTSPNFGIGNATKGDNTTMAVVEIYASSTTNVDASSASTSTGTTPSVTTTAANDLVVSLGASGTSTDFATQPGGWTMGPTITSGNQVCSIAYKTFASTGATGTAAWNAGGNKVFTVAVKG